MQVTISPVSWDISHWTRWTWKRYFWVMLMFVNYFFLGQVRWLNCRKSSQSERNHHRNWSVLEVSMYLELGGLIFLLPIALHVVKTILRKYSSLFIHDFDAVKRFPLINLALSFSLVFIQIPLLASIKLLRLFIMNNQKIAFY